MDFQRSPGGQGAPGSREGDADGVQRRGSGARPGVRPLARGAELIAGGHA